METIEKRAGEYIHTLCDGKCEKCCMWLPNCRLFNAKGYFIAGARSEHEELTRWHDPNKELPINARDVLVKFRDALTYNARYDVGFFADGWWHIRAFNAHNKILGWREIHEP